jgi:CubicO group peptidase (beta-lactamase class C family)
MLHSHSVALCALLVPAASIASHSTLEGGPATAHPACGDRPTLTFPGKTWTVIDPLAGAGWDQQKLSAAHAYADSIGSHAVVIVDHGHLVAEWGGTHEELIVQSIRKSVLNALIGIAVEEGRLSPDATHSDLKITDTPPPLSPAERAATVRQLMQSRSGISHPAAASPFGEVPKRGEHAPGAFWFYNNWDFNVLGTIYEKAMNSSVYAQIEQRLAVPLQMEHYSKEDGEYQLEPVSEHPAYHFSMSARDLARFGLLYLACGRWNDRQIVPREWVEESLQPYSEVTNPWTPKGTLGYGYMWYIDHPFGGFSARGGTGQRVAILPEQGLVIVHRISDNKPVFDGPLDELIRRILAARSE